MSKTATQFQNWLDENGVANCPCGHKFSLADVDWTTGQTEYGTEFTFVEVECPRCQKFLVEANSWYPAGSIQEVVEHVLPEAEFKPA